MTSGYKKRGNMECIAFNEVSEVTYRQAAVSVWNRLLPELVLFIVLIWGIHKWICQPWFMFSISFVSTRDSAAGTALPLLACPPWFAFTTHNQSWNNFGAEEKGAVWLCSAVLETLILFHYSSAFLALIAFSCFDENFDVLTFHASVET